MTVPSASEVDMAGNGWTRMDILGMGCPQYIGDGMPTIYGGWVAQRKVDTVFANTFPLHCQCSVAVLTASITDFLVFFIIFSSTKKITKTTKKELKIKQKQTQTKTNYSCFWNEMAGGEAADDKW